MFQDFYCKAADFPSLSFRDFWLKSNKNIFMTTETVFYILQHTFKTHVAIVVILLEYSDHNMFTPFFPYYTRMGQMT